MQMQAMCFLYTFLSMLHRSMIKELQRELLVLSIRKKREWKIFLVTRKKSFMYNWTVNFTSILEEKLYC